MATLRRAFVAAVALAALAACVSADGGKVDLPVATSGTEQWAGTVAKAMSFGAKDQGNAMKNFQSFQTKVMKKLQQQASLLFQTDTLSFTWFTGASLQKLGKGDVSDVIAAALKNADSISAPVFFANGGGPQTTLLDTIAAIQFGFAGVAVAPCAIPVTPLGVGIFPQGVNINPIGAYITPIGVNIQPQGANISPTLIVIGPYDTTVAGQGLNIAPALIAIAPIRTVVNPVGPLAITDVLVPITAPALP